MFENYNEDFSDAHALMIEQVYDLSVIGHQYQRELKLIDETISLLEEQLTLQKHKRSRVRDFCRNLHPRTVNSAIRIRDKTGEMRDMLLAILGQNPHSTPVRKKNSQTLAAHVLDFVKENPGCKGSEVVACVKSLIDEGKYKTISTNYSGLVSVALNNLKAKKLIIQPQGRGTGYYNIINK